MTFPSYMLDATRWMVRPEGKQPVSAHETKPFNYEPPPGKEDPNGVYWRWRWTVPAVWANISAAKSYLDRYPETEGLSYVLHPVGAIEEQLRLVCFDYDGCIKNGKVDNAVSDAIYLIDSFVEFSRSRNGLHNFFLVRCPAFTNLRGRPIGNCKVDVLCSAQIAVTGDVFAGYNKLRTIPYSFLEKLPFFDFQPVIEETEFPEWWDVESVGIDTKHDYIIDMMESWPTAVEGQQGSQKLFAAACRLLEHGIYGQEALQLLNMVPAEPAFSPQEIRRTLECAYPHVATDNALNTKGPQNEFSVIEVQKTDDPDYGFTPIPVDKLMTMDLKLEYLIDRAFVGEGALIVGGQEKTFKTGVVIDLLISLATRKPWLNEFNVNDYRTSVIFTAEIGLPTAQLLIKRITDFKKVDESELRGIDIVETIPTFTMNRNTNQPGNQPAMVGLKRYLDDRKPQIAVFDPLYLAMIGAAVGDMYEIGSILQYISTMCRQRDIWAIFCHHAKKGSTVDNSRPMELSDMYGSGVGAFARQWCLLSHVEPFRDGRAKLYANIGGSAAGDRGVWILDIDEGQDDGIMERVWRVKMEQLGETRSGISYKEIEAAIRELGQGGGVKVAELQWYVQSPSSAAVDRVLRDMVKSGIVQMMPNKKFGLREPTEF